MVLKLPVFASGDPDQSARPRTLANTYIIRLQIQCLQDIFEEQRSLSDCAIVHGGLGLRYISQREKTDLLTCECSNQHAHAHIHAQWRNFTSLSIRHAPSEASDQTARMRSLIWVFAGHTRPKVRLLTLGLKCLFYLFIFFLYV